MKPDENNRPEDQLLVAIKQDTAYLRVVNRGSFRNGKALKEFGEGAIETGVRSFLVDMSACAGMDSTFMGVIAGLASRLKLKCQGRMYMLNLSPRTRGLLATLGLDQLVETHVAGEDSFSEGKGELKPVDAAESNRLETAEIMLDAHQQLVHLSPENLPRFKDVLSFLREDIEKEKTGDSGHSD